MSEKRKAEEEKFQMKLMNCNSKKERDTFHVSETSFDAHKLYSTCSNDKACAIIFPNCLKLLHLMLIFPLSTACVKRFFSKMNIVKIRLQNQLSQVNLENLLLHGVIIGLYSLVLNSMFVHCYRSTPNRIYQ